MNHAFDFAVARLTASSGGSADGAVDAETKREHAAPKRERD